jgi:hypothetical protein
MNAIQTLANIMAGTYRPQPERRQHEGAEFELHTGDLWKTRNNFRELRIQCLDGILWITQTGDPNDIVLTPGEEFVARRRALVIVQSLTEARVQIQRAYKSGQSLGSRNVL